MSTIRHKDKTAAILFCLFLGGFGAHKFYLGRTGMGVVYLLFFWTLIPGFVAFIDLIVLATMKQEAFDRAYNGQ